MNKLHNKKVTIGGETYASEKEYARWCELKLLERAGEIKRLQKQVPFELIPSQIETFPRYGKKGQRLKDGTRTLERGCYYVADFVYYDKSGKMVVEDTKGCKKGATYRIFALKRKMMLEKYGIRVREI